MRVERALAGWFALTWCLGSGACTTTYSFDTATRPSCRGDSNCPPGLHCETAQSYCVGCSTDPDCADGGARSKCDTTRNACVECLAKEDCGDDALCDLSTNRCVAACDDDEDDLNCQQATGHCEQGRCIKCPSPCPAPLVCDWLAGQCVECFNDALCKSPLPFCDRTNGRCVQCLIADQCPLSTPWCDPRGGQCVAAEDVH